MKVPFSWLTEYCDPGLEPEQVAELLSMRAVEVERVTRIGVPSTDGFVVGRVISAERHPNADRLRVCEVETGEGVQTVVCGAPNVAAGQTVAMALPGSVMPDGSKLKKAKLRGVVSNGMILSERELGLSDEHEGILVFAGEHEPGVRLDSVLPIVDAVLELDLNPNRVDCMGVYGVAREVHAITGEPLADPPWDLDAEATGSDGVETLASVRVEVPRLCPRFSARAFTGVEIRSSPAWLKARLTAAGMRPISNVVDITNYVMLMTAQPLHAFDLDKLPGGELIIRAASEGEKMTTLDGVERSFDSETVLVCDREQPAGIAGIMGGLVSEVSDETSRVLLEVATWNGANILRTSALLGLRSDASARYEKQLHPELALRAQRLASRLLVELCGATLEPGTIDVTAEIPERHRITLRGERADSLLGVELAVEESTQHLARLGFDPAPHAGVDIEVTVPVHRHYDVTREVDVIEEVGRLHGFDKLPRTLPAHAALVGGLSPEQQGRRRAEDVMRDLGFDEIVAWAFVDPSLADRLRLPAEDRRRSAIATANPISKELSQMRTMLLGGLLDAVRHNVARGAQRVCVFGSGRIYLPERPAEASENEVDAAIGVLAGSFAGRIASPALEPHRIGAVAIGGLAPDSWVTTQTEVEAAGFFALKGALEVLATQLGGAVAFVAATEPFLHLGRAARVEADGRAIGWIGELHPLVSRAWDLPPANAFELDLAPLLAAAAAGNEVYEDVTTFPAVLQDIAVVIADDVSAQRVREAALAGGGELLAAADIFDVYRGVQVGENRKSLALRLEFRASDRTLTDAEVTAVRKRIEEELARLGGSLRG